MRPWYDPGYISTDSASHSQSAQKIFRIYFRKHFRNILKPEIFRIYFQKHFRNILKPEIFRNILQNVSKYIAYAKSFERFCMFAKSFEKLCYYKFAIVFNNYIGYASLIKGTIIKNRIELQLSLVYINLFGPLLFLC